MKDSLFENTKLASYHLWLQTKGSNTVSLWCCAEDIACFFEENGIENQYNIRNIIEKGFQDSAYIYFIKNIAFRLYLYTNESDALKNWLDAEALSRNKEWLESQLHMAHCLKSGHNTQTVLSSWVKNHYKKMYNE